MKGVQGVDASGRGYLQAASTPKHYAGYNLDNWHGMDRCALLVLLVLLLPLCAC